MSTENDRDGEGAGGAPETTPVEWVIAAIGLLMVLSAAGYMVYNASTDSGEPPEIVLAVDTIVPAAGGYLVMVGAENIGGATAAALQVDGELKSDTGTVETASATLSYVPTKAKRRAGLIFENDPRRYELKLKAKGYDLP